jgi:hypothetical protein
MPRSHAPDAEYTLEGLLVCLLCGDGMQPAPRVDGTRAYCCGPGCTRSELDAPPAESSAELHALVRATVSLCPDLGGANAIDHERSADAGTEERRRFEQCNLSDRRALVRAAFVRIEVGADGVVRPVRRGAS